MAGMCEPMASTDPRPPDDQATTPGRRCTQLCIWAGGMDWNWVSTEACQVCP